MVSSIRCGLLDVIENLEEEEKAYKAPGTPYQVPPVTFIQIWSCQITTFFQQPCINSRELLWCNFSLNTEHLEGCGAATLQSLSCFQFRPGGLCCSLSRQWAPFKEQSNKDLLVERSAQAQICLLAVSSLPSPQLRFPCHPRCLNVRTQEASFTWSRESVPGPCCSTQPCPSRWTLSRAFHQLPNQDWLTVP